MAQKAYFLMPNFDYAPDKLVKVGQIISDLRSPSRAVGGPLQPVPEIETSYKDSWESEKARTISGSVGVWARFLATVLGLGGTVAGNFLKDDSKVFKFQRLEAFFFEPSEEYIRASMELDTVRKFFEQNPKKSAFMITGVKIARGAEVGRKRREDIGWEGSVGFDATHMGVPVSTGPETSFSRRTVDDESFAGSSDFVFAYRLRRIYIRRKTGQIENADYIKGAMFHEGNKKPLEEQQDQKVAALEDVAAEFEVVGFDDEDFGSDNILPGFKSISARDDDEECICVSATSGIV
jgi:hypothetical protein